MMKSHLRLLLAPLCLLSLPVLAQTDGDALPPPDPADAAIRDIMDKGPEGIDIAPDRRADMSACDGTTAPGVLQAIQNCWPVLETYRDYAPLITAMDAWKASPPARQALANPKSETATAAADRIIATASARRYPAQDVPLMVAHLARGMIDRAQGDLESYIAHVSTARSILATSRITASGFVGGGEELDRQIAEAKEELAKQKAAN